MKWIALWFAYICAGCAATLAADGPEEALVIGPVQVRPLNMHMGIWRDVEGCLGIASAPEIRWYIARLIIITGDDMQAYGITTFNGDTPIAIIIDRAHWLDARVVAHEVEHAIRRNRDENMRCPMSIPGSPLPERPVHPDTLAKYREMSGGR